MRRLPRTEELTDIAIQQMKDRECGRLQFWLPNETSAYLEAKRLAISAKAQIGSVSVSSEAEYNQKRKRDDDVQERLTKRQATKKN